MNNPILENLMDGDIMYFSGILFWFIVFIYILNIYIDRKKRKELGYNNFEMDIYKSYNQFFYNYGLTFNSGKIAENYMNKFFEKFIRDFQSKTNIYTDEDRKEMKASMEYKYNLDFIINFFKKWMRK